MPPTSPTPAARSSTTSTSSPGATTSAGSSTCPARSCRTCAPRAATTAPWPPTCSERRCRSRAAPATRRRPPSGRASPRPAMPRPPTARAPFSSSRPATGSSRAATACSPRRCAPPAARRLIAWKGPCSWLARSWAGFAMASGSSSVRPTSNGSPPAWPRAAASRSCRLSRGSAPHTGTPRPAA